MKTRHRLAIGTTLIAALAGPVIAGAAHAATPVTPAPTAAASPSGPQSLTRADKLKLLETLKAAAHKIGAQRAQAEITMAKWLPDGVLRGPAGTSAEEIDRLLPQMIQAAHTWYSTRYNGPEHDKLFDEAEANGVNVRDIGEAWRAGYDSVPNRPAPLGGLWDGATGEEMAQRFVGAAARAKAVLQKQADAEATAAKTVSSLEVWGASNDLSAPSGELFSEPVWVQAKNAKGGNVAGAELTYTISGDTGTTFDGGTSTFTGKTSDDGRLASPALKAGTKPGTVTVTVTAPGNLTTIVTVTVTENELQKADHKATADLKASLENADSHLATAQDALKAIQAAAKDNNADDTTVNDAKVIADHAHKAIDQAKAIAAKLAGGNQAGKDAANQINHEAGNLAGQIDTALQQVQDAAHKVVLREDQAQVSFKAPAGRTGEILIKGTGDDGKPFEVRIKSGEQATVTVPKLVPGTDHTAQLAVFVQSGGQYVVTGAVNFHYDGHKITGATVTDHLTITGEGQHLTIAWDGQRQS